MIALIEIALATFVLLALASIAASSCRLIVYCTKVALVLVVEIICIPFQMIAIVREVINECTFMKKLNFLLQS